MIFPHFPTIYDYDGVPCNESVKSIYQTRSYIIAHPPCDNQGWDNFKETRSLSFPHPPRTSSSPTSRRRRNSLSLAALSLTASISFSGLATLTAVEYWVLVQKLYLSC